MSFTLNKQYYSERFHFHVPFDLNETINHLFRYQCACMLACCFFLVETVVVLVRKCSCSFCAISFVPRKIKEKQYTLCFTLVYWVFSTGTLWLLKNKQRVHMLSVEKMCRALQSHSFSNIISNSSDFCKLIGLCFHEMWDKFVESWITN